jgi:hypothetical protein
LLRERATQDKNENVRQAAIQELARGWHDDPGTLPLLRERAVGDDDWLVRQGVKKELAQGWPDSADVRAFLAGCPNVPEPLFIRF